MNTKKINVALVGLGFGSQFVPIYQSHPDVASVSIADTDPELLAATSSRFGVERTYSKLDEVLADESIDAVHLLTPIPLHANHSVAVLKSAKHCACAVPMATSLEDIGRIVSAQRASGKNYMMMETTVYTRAFLMVQERFSRGEFGQISFARGHHLHDMEGWPGYWVGLPPHHYSTHALAPLLKLLGKRVKKVHCLGSGILPPERQEPYRNPFSAATAIYRLHDSPVAVEIARTTFRTMRSFSESFAIYGDKLGFEWQQTEDGKPLFFSLGQEGFTGYLGRERKIIYKAVEPPDRQDLLPSEIARYTQGEYKGGGHHGSHPHLVHEFIRSIVERRSPIIDAVTAADWTAPGIAAHISAMADGEAIEVPDFSSK